MSNKKIFELILNTAGFTMENYGLIRDGSFMVGYEFEAHLDGRFKFQIAIDNFADAIKETLEHIYNIPDIKFKPIYLAQYKSK